MGNCVNLPLFLTRKYPHCETFSARLFRFELTRMVLCWKYCVGRKLKTCFRNVLGKQPLLIPPNTPDKSVGPLPIFRRDSLRHPC